MKRVFLINGPAGVGKDTFVELARTHFMTRGVATVHNIATVDLVKAAATLLGWNGVKDEKSRQFLSDIKDLSTIYNNGPQKHIIDSVLTSNDNDVTFAHCREPIDIMEISNALQEKGHFVRTIFVNRPGVMKYKNHADTNTQNFKYDFEISNDSTITYLDELALNFVKQVLS